MQAGTSSQPKRIRHYGRKTWRCWRHHERVPQRTPLARRGETLTTSRCRPISHLECTGCLTCLRRHALCLIASRLHPTRSRGEHRRRNSVSLDNHVAVVNLSALTQGQECRRRNSEAVQFLLYISVRRCSCCCTCSGMKGVGCLFSRKNEGEISFHL